MNKDALILVTGGNGMVGRALVAKLHEAGYNQVLVPSSECLDLRHGEIVERYFHHNPIDYVFHLAARVGGIAANIADPYRFLRDNLLINCNVLDACQGFNVKKVINLGSSCMYPRECAQPMTEDKLLTGPLEPTNEGYALAKLCAQRLCRYAGPDFVTLIPCNLYGPYDHFGVNSSHVVPALISRFIAARNEAAPEVVVWGSGNARREFLHVDDVVSAMLYFMQFDGVLPDAINIGTGMDVTITQLADCIAQEVNYQGSIVFDRTKPDGMPQKKNDISRAVLLGWHPEIVLREGLHRTIAWYEAQRDNR